MNCKKVLPSESGFHRDWRGLATLVKLDQNEFGAILRSNDHMMKLIEFWIQKYEDAKIIQLIQYLEIIDRFDVSDDIELLCCKCSENSRNNSLNNYNLYMSR